MKMQIRIKSWAAVALPALAIAASNPVWAHGDLTVVSWGGAYTRSQILAYVEPYERETGMAIDVEDYNGGLEEIRSQVSSQNVKWDLVDLDLADATRGCEQGLLEKIDHSVLAPAPDSTPASDDFLSGMLPECAVGQVIWSTVVAYDAARFKSNPPATLADFFDVSRYPGKRGLRKSPRVNLEWALLADGVPADKIYETLSTEEGIQRAFEKLESIKRHVVWWEAGSAPPRMLADGEVAMTSAFNGRIYSATVDKGLDFAIVWDGQVWDFDLWAIPKRTNRTASIDQVLEFVKFATDTQRLADQAKYISYGPARKSSMALVSDDIKPHLPTAPDNAKNALRIDHQWWAEHQEVLDRRFNHWVGRKRFMDWQGP